MNFVKEMKWQSLLYAALYILMGIILLLFPETTARTICYLVGGASIGYGCITVLMYLFRDADKNSYRNDFVIGLIEIMVGIFVFYKAELIISLVPFVLGIFVVISGFIKLQGCIDIRRMGYGSGLVLFVLAMINIVLGVLLVANPSFLLGILFQLIGAGLLFSGISDLIVTAYVFGKVKSFRRDKERTGEDSILSGQEDDKNIERENKNIDRENKDTGRENKDAGRENKDAGRENKDVDRENKDLN